MSRAERHAALKRGDPAAWNSMRTILHSDDASAIQEILDALKLPPML